MKKNHPPSGMGFAVRMLVYPMAFIAMLGIREILSDGNGPVSQNLGMVFNKTLMTSSKFGLGVALMNEDNPGERTLIGKSSRALGMASHQAYVSAAKVELYAR
jgi:hypothetical protein